MCGIAGIARTDGAGVDRRLIEAMCQAQAHRGPNVRGVHVGDGVGLGIQRLRVIDLATGDQPIYNEDRSVIVILNGEIYNYKELRRKLSRGGHQLATEADTEVIVHLYEEHGPACVNELHGMFAFALWDEKRRQLMLARDRIGKKPLFYGERAGALSFASELWALMQDPEIPRQPDHGSIDTYLAYGYIPAPESGFRAVRKLPPASTLLYRDGGARVDQYWRLAYDRKCPLTAVPEMEAEIRQGIRRAVRRRMVSDVPMGAFLSGGIDSAAVVAAMAEHASGAVKTFSIGFEDERFNELPKARRVAQEFATDHHELVVRPDAIAMLPRIVHHYGEPFADHSALPCFYLSRFASEHVTVALNGDGGDECFGGYHRYSTHKALADLDRLPAGARRILAAAARQIPHHPSAHSRISAVRRLAVSSPQDPDRRYIAEMSMFDELERAALYTPEFANTLDAFSADHVLRDPWHKSSATGVVDRLLDVDVNTYLPGDLLAKMDIATMAFSLEGRSPLLDHELMEFAASLPSQLKANIRSRKLVLRSALAGWIPQEILDAPKRGFELPVARWLRTDLKDYAYSVLLDRSARERDLFSQPAVRRVLDEHTTGARDRGRELWALLMLELWFQELDRPSISFAA